MAFRGSPETGMQCCHIDGVRTNNCADNLCWGTAKDNAADRSWHGNWNPLRGEDHSQAKLSNVDVEEIRALIDDGVAYADISSRFPVGKSQISRIKTGKRHMPSTVIGLPSDGKYLGRVQGNSKERREGHPNQLPEVYLERLLRAYTNPGDRVLDPFCGSGTTPVVADALGRECVAIDVSKANCKSANRRVADGAVRVEM
jgi:DNA modification methylase